MPEGGYRYPLEVLEQKATPDGIVLKARVDYLNEERQKLVNYKIGTFEGKVLEIVLFHW